MFTFQEWVIHIFLSIGVHENSLRNRALHRYNLKRWHSKYPPERPWKWHALATWRYLQVHSLQSSPNTQSLAIHCNRKLVFAANSRNREQVVFSVYHSVSVTMTEGELTWAMEPAASYGWPLENNHMREQRLRNFSGQCHLYHSVY